jgi:uncharacterized Zn finger protein
MTDYYHQDEYYEDEEYDEDYYDSCPQCGLPEVWCIGVASLIDSSGDTEILVYLMECDACGFLWRDVE